MTVHVAQELTSEEQMAGDVEEIDRRVEELLREADSPSVALGYQDAP